MGITRGVRHTAENSCNPLKQREANQQAQGTGGGAQISRCQTYRLPAPVFWGLWQGFLGIETALIPPVLHPSRWGEPAGRRQGRLAAPPAPWMGFSHPVPVRSCWRAGIWTMSALWSTKTKVAFHSELLRKAVAL